MRKRRYWLVVAILFFAADIRAQQNEKILIAAASDMKFALDSVIKVFNLSHKGAVGVTYSASGKLFEQISNGAPFDLFFSADISFPENLREKGFALSEVHTYGVGRVVIWSKKIDPSKEGIKTLLQPGIKKIAIANPQHAPYGRRAEEALKYYGVYDQVKERLVLGENISQAAQFITTGAADIGIIALSLALSPTMKKEGKYYIIPEDSHHPLLQGSIITTHARGNLLAATFHEFMESKQAIDILHYFGLSEP